MKNNDITFHEHPDKILVSLQIHEQKNIDSDISYDQYVSMGRELLKKVDCYQARIAFYALKVCTIKHGGISKNVYTCKDYAISLGIPVHTLSEWTLIYRNVINRLDISLEAITNEIWRNARRTNDRLGWDTAESRKTGGLSKNKKFKEVAPIQELRRFYKEESGQHEASFQTEFRGFTTALMNMKTKIAKRDLNLIHEGDLLQLMRLLDQVSDALNDFLTAKKKKK
jgi:hypothetical protein